MKAFNYLRILFLAIISLLIISCDNNDEDSGLLGSQTSSSIPDERPKKLVKIDVDAGENRGTIIYYKYDKNGLLSLVNITEYDCGEVYKWDTHLKWTDNAILYSADGTVYDEAYTISNGKVVKDLHFTEYGYDANGCLSILLSLYPESIGKKVFTWDAGKLVNTKENYNYGESSYSITERYTYSSHAPQRCKGFFPNMAIHYWDGGDKVYVFDGDDFVFSAIPCVLGIEQQDLPQMIEEERVSVSIIHKLISASRYVYDYTFYDDGYLKSCTRRYFNRDEKSGEYKEDKEWVTVYEYFWE